VGARSDHVVGVDGPDRLGLRAQVAQRGPLAELVIVADHPVGGGVGLSVPGKVRERHIIEGLESRTPRGVQGVDVPLVEERDVVPECRQGVDAGNEALRLRLPGQIAVRQRPLHGQVVGEQGPTVSAQRGHLAPEVG